MASKFVDYAKTVCRIQYGRYTSGQVAIWLTNYHTGEIVATATVNIKDLSLAQDQVVIKNHAENKGVMKALSDVGVIRPTGERIQLGHDYGYICTLRKTEPL